MSVGADGTTVELPTPTAKQVEALRWLIARKLTERLDSTALWVKYADEEKERSHHARRVVAWKRVSGANMAAMKRAGLLAYDYSLHQSRRLDYRITDAGFAAAGVAGGS